MFKLSAGPMWTTSKLYLTADAKEYVSDQRGYGMALSMSYTGNKAYGYGLDFYGSRTEIEIPSKYSYIGVDPTYLMMYLGPSVLIGGNITPWMRIDLSLGIGAAYYHDDAESKFGFGSRASLGLEFLVTKTVGLGVDCVRQRGIFSKPDGFKQPDNEAYGFENLGVMFTARFHY